MSCQRQNQIVSHTTGEFYQNICIASLKITYEEMKREREKIAQLVVPGEESEGHRSQER